MQTGRHNKKQFIRSWIGTKIVIRNHEWVNIKYRAMAEWLSTVIIMMYDGGKSAHF